VRNRSKHLLSLFQGSLRSTRGRPSRGLSPRTNPSQHDFTGLLSGKDRAIPQGKEVSGREAPARASGSGIGGGWRELKSRSEGRLSRA
jgi:hypothetical protein